MAERARHILDGDATGGGHRHGTGRPGKTEFPANWTDQKITMDSLRLMEAGGEYGELTIELAATLAARNVPVTLAERDELAALLDAMGLPADPIARLNVQA